MPKLILICDLNLRSKEDIKRYPWAKGYMDLLDANREIGTCKDLIFEDIVRIVEAYRVGYPKHYVVDDELEEKQIFPKLDQFLKELRENQQYETTRCSIEGKKDEYLNVSHLFPVEYLREVFINPDDVRYKHLDEKAKVSVPGTDLILPIKRNRWMIPKDVESGIYAQ